MIRRVRTSLLLGTPGLALTIGTTAMMLESPGADHLLEIALTAVGGLLVWAVAVAVRLRYPERPLSRLLLLLAGTYSLQALVVSSNPYFFTLGRVARPAIELLLVWVMLAFPSGHLQGRREQAIVAAGAMAILTLWLPAVMLSPDISIAGPLVPCPPTCPRNILFVADQPMLSQMFYIAFRNVSALLLVVTAALLFIRLRQATALMRRSLAPVLFASIARTLSITVFLVSDHAAPGLTVTFWAIPLAIALGLLRGRLYTAAVLQRLVTGLRTRPDMEKLRDVMAQALSDASLLIAYWLPDTKRWITAEGQGIDLTSSSLEPGRAISVVQNASGEPVAALNHDIGLLDEPALIDSVASSVLAALESHRMEVELRASHIQVASAAEKERRRIERDLHDGAQQRLIALRMKLSVISRLFEHDTRRAKELINEMEVDVETAIVELRAFARGITPPLLVERGLAEALKEVAHRAAIPIRFEIEDVGHCDPAIEYAVYFCCLEALQNAAKHAGVGATARLALWCEGSMLLFYVRDDGSGLTDIARSAEAQGLSNMRERIEAVGGQIEITNRHEGGVCVFGKIALHSPN